MSVFFLSFRRWLGVCKKIQIYKTNFNPFLIHLDGLVSYSNLIFWILNPIQLSGYGYDICLDF